MISMLTKIPSKTLALWTIQSSFILKPFKPNSIIDGELNIKYQSEKYRITKINLAIFDGHTSGDLNDLYNIVNSIAALFILQYLVFGKQYLKFQLFIKII
jgi:hypothetical protein